MEVVGQDVFWNLHKIAFDKQKYPIFAKDMVSLFEISQYINFLVKT
jgi:hypothetical protein